MKKIILSLIITCFILFPAIASEFLPRYNNNIKNYGIGLYFGNGTATIYQSPDEKSPIIAKLNWDAENVYFGNKIASPKNIFAVFIPEKGLSGFIATDEQGIEFTEIIYDNSKGLKGWIKNAPDNKAFYWRQLFYKYGKTKGLYLFANMDKSTKYLMVAPSDEAEVSHKIIYPKFIKLQLIKGNWALIKVVDYDNEQKVGWYKWRNSDGTLNLFPDFNG